MKQTLPKNALSIDNTISDFITPKQLEAEFSISINQQHYLRSKRSYKQNPSPFPFYKIIGVGVRYKRSEILEWIERQKVVHAKKVRAE